jgi:hypothetical protein
MLTLTVYKTQSLIQYTLKFAYVFGRAVTLYNVWTKLNRDESPKIKVNIYWYLNTFCSPEHKVKHKSNIYLLSKLLFTHFPLLFASVTFIFKYIKYKYIIIFSGSAAQRGLWPLRITRLLDHTQRRTTVGSTPLDERSARRRDIYLTTHNRQTSSPQWDSNPRS